MSQSPQGQQQTSSGFSSGMNNFPSSLMGMSPFANWQGQQGGGDAGNMWNYYNPSLTSPYLWGQYSNKPNNIFNAYSPNAFSQFPNFYGGQQMNPMGGWGMMGGQMSPFAGGGFNPYGIPFAGYGGNLGGAPPGAYGQMAPTPSKNGTLPELTNLSGGGGQPLGQIGGTPPGQGGTLGTFGQVGGQAPGQGGTLGTFGPVGGQAPGQGGTLGTFLAQYGAVPR